MSGAPPLVEGRQPLVADWSLVLPFPMARRVEDGALVFWHSPRGLTFWINAYDAGEPDDALAEWQEIHAAAAFDLIEEREADFIRFAYRLDEDAEDGRQPAFYGFACARDGGQIQQCQRGDPRDHPRQFRHTLPRYEWRVASGEWCVMRDT